MIKPRIKTKEQNIITKDRTLLAFKTGDDFVFFSVADNRIEKFLVCQGNKASYKDIYIARVNKYIKGIKGYFLAISDKEEVFLQEDEIGQVKLLNRKYDGCLKCGDTLPVQIKKEAYKNKSAYGTTMFELTGSLSVVSLAKTQGQVSISKKIEDKKRILIRDTVLSYFASKDIDISKYNITVRTGDFATLEEIDTLISDLCSDIEEKIAFLDSIEDKCKNRLLYNKIYTDSSALYELIKDSTKIIADNKDAYDYIKELAPQYEITLYEDSKVDLVSLYGLKSKYQNIISDKVNLKNDGYIYINPTEALNVIDVNSGSAKNSKDKNQYILDVNLEAAKEIALQLRLRNLSGMIMIDFINMNSSEDKKAIIACLRKEFAKDKISTNFIDITGLDVYEITRKKQRRPIYELIRNTDGGVVKCLKEQYG